MAGSHGVTGILVVMRGSSVSSSLSDELATRWDGRIVRAWGVRGTVAGCNAVSRDAGGVRSLPRAESRGV